MWWPGPTTSRPQHGDRATFEADLFGYDRANDIVLLQLRRPGPAGGRTEAARRLQLSRWGQPVPTIGNANGLGQP